MKRLVVAGLAVLAALFASMPLLGSNVDCFSDENLMDVRILEELAPPSDGTLQRARETALAAADDMNKVISEIQFALITSDSPSARNIPAFVIGIPDQRGPYPPFGGGTQWKGPDLVSVECQVVVTNATGDLLFVQELQKPAE